MIAVNLCKPYWKYFRQLQFADAPNVGDEIEVQGYYLSRPMEEIVCIVKIRRWCTPVIDDGTRKAVWIELEPKDTGK